MAANALRNQLTLTLAPRKFNTTERKIKLAQAFEDASGLAQKVHILNLLIDQHILEEDVNSADNNFSEYRKLLAVLQMKL